jgi:hypothetical protein
MPCGSEVLSRMENYTSHTCMKCVRVILFPVVSDTASGVLDRMENYTSRTCLNGERVNLFLVASEIASGVRDRLKKSPTAGLITPEVHIVP